MMRRRLSVCLMVVATGQLAAAQDNTTGGDPSLDQRVEIPGTDLAMDGHRRQRGLREVVAHHGQRGGPGQRRFTLRARAAGLPG